MIMALKGTADGNTKVQEDNLTELVKEYPNDERAEFLLGTFYFGQQMYDKAISHLKKSTEIAPDYSGAYNLLGYAYRSTNNYPEAEKTFKKYIELLPNDPNPYDSYAELLLKEGKYKESIDQYRKALSIDPEFHASYNGLSTAYTFLRKYDDARKELTTFYNNARNDGEKRTALFGMTVAYADEGNLSKALEQMQKQYDIADKGKDDGAKAADLNAMGNILFEQGKYAEAMKKFDDAQKITLASGLSNEVKENAKNFAVYNNARILLMKNDLKAAKEKSNEFEQKAKKANNSNLVWLSHQLKGQIAIQEKDYKKALGELKMANRQDPYTYYYVGLAYQGTGDVEKAKQAFKTASTFNNLNNLNQAFVREKAEKMIAVK
jgi:tetratricopeptide (TPR) repeat protein